MKQIKIICLACAIVDLGMFCHRELTIYWADTKKIKTDQKHLTFY